MLTELVTGLPELSVYSVMDDVTSILSMMVREIPCEIHYEIWCEIGCEILLLAALMLVALLLAILPLALAETSGELLGDDPVPGADVSHATSVTDDVVVLV